ncbi:hypothetical protein GCM10012275_47250 [Longimycelium tulufanense]|uniref:Uncharacterized protein n=1 Tax=Longimycelium tulufanense TaxID=907463 RepID=A0A8J3CFG7_9PSEU|nr:hypothetical protein GCM10012275_47250 [Longimycelium tulufanense]
MYTFPSVGSGVAEGTPRGTNKVAITAAAAPAAALVSFGMARSPSPGASWHRGAVCGGLVEPGRDSNTPAGGGSPDASRGDGRRWAPGAGTVPVLVKFSRFRTL